MKKYIVGISLGFAFVFPVSAQTIAEKAPVERPIFEKVQSENEQLMESVGAMSSSSLYLAYISLAAIHESLDNQNYNADQVDILITSVSETLGIINGQLKRLKAMPTLSFADAQLLGDMEEISALLEEESVFLKRYTKSKSLSDLSRFEDTQAKTWQKIKILFGMEEEK
ncbi:MAG TPA: hypothetical protein VEC36_03825 [Patescibacteria group bacterium]|nr:hypothetical protein [Patescibacteria group bacterium]